jgi:methionyl-tRNA synthetase
MSSRYITTPIYYVNDRPHMGHAYASVHADVMARYLRAAGHDVFLLTGADEHGEKIARAAAQAGETPAAFVARHARDFKDAWRELGVVPDHFVRTTDASHRRAVQRTLQRLFDAGEIYQAEYHGLYSIGQERFVTDKELVAGKLPEDKDPPVERTEVNYFFRMERHRDWMRELLLADPDLIQPSRYRNEILQLLDEPIGDLSISRPASRLSWGIPIPWDAAHVTYVWFDALLSYLSPLGYPGDADDGATHARRDAAPPSLLNDPDCASTPPRTRGAAFERFWPSAAHLIGKDILRTHTLFWLSMGHAMGIAPYRRLHVSGHLLGADGRKMSKSLGNGVDPLEAARRYGADVLRYTLVREVSFGSDGIVSHAVIEQRLTRDLADDLGNLASRTLAMIRKYRQGIVPAAHDPGSAELAIAARVAALPAEVLGLVEEMRLAQATELVMECVRHLNRYVASAAPWELAKSPAGDARLDTVLYTVVEALCAVADLLAPVMPARMAELRGMLGLDAVHGWARPWGSGIRPGTRVGEGTLFPKPPAQAMPA